MTAYIFDQAWHAERDRLDALEELHGAATERLLAALGVGAGWHCLEVGCGAGGVARWLAARVGPGGRVVATDVDPRFMQDDHPDNLEVRRHDIVNDPLEEGAYDLAHARAVLEHIAGRNRALERMVAALRPGGWIVIEDTYFDGAMNETLLRCIVPAEEGATFGHLLRGFELLYGAVGADPCFGPKLPALFRGAGLVNVGAELHAPFVWGGAEREFMRLSAAHMRGKLVQTGAVTDDEVQRYLDLSTGADFGGLGLPMVTAWGQRPPA